MKRLKGVFWWGVWTLIVYALAGLCIYLYAIHS
jgi:hypothetical protein